MADQQIDATIGDDTSNAAIGNGNRQIVTTTTTTATATDSPRLEANPQIYIQPGANGNPFDAILLSLVQQSNILNGQNNVLSRLESKFDNHIAAVEQRFDAVDTRFKALEKTTTMVEIAIGTIQDKLRIMDRTNAELEHASTLRGQQTVTMETQIREVKAQQTQLVAELQTIKAAIAQASQAQVTQATAQALQTQALQTQVAAQAPAPARPDNHSRLMFALFIAALVAITALNLYLMMSTGK